jgi:hypothetical protein
MENGLYPIYKGHSRNSGIINTVQQIENHGAHYAGLVESDERWETVYSVWLYQVKFSGYPNFKIFDFGGSLD